MALELFGHPFSSYTWKALIPLYETGTAFTFRNISGSDHPENEAAFLQLWPVGKFPLLVDDRVPVMESSVIVEHVAPGLIPADPDAAREVRMLDRIFDNHVMMPVQAVVAEHLPFLTLTPDMARVPRARARRWTRSIRGSMRSSQGEHGQPARISRSLTVRAAQRCSTLIGCRRFRRALPRSAPIAHGCSRARRLCAWSMKPGPIATSSRSARPIAIDRQRSLPCRFPM